MKSLSHVKKWNILVIDDDELILNSIEKQLKNEDFNLDMVNNPLLGLEKIDNNEFDIILCDIKMKPILGIEVLKRVKEKYPNLPVVILTGFVDDKLMSKAKELGCNDFLIKPIRKSKLIKTINDILNI